MPEYKVHITCDGKAVMSQTVTEEFLNEQVWPMMEEAAEDRRKRSSLSERYANWDNLSDEEKAAMSQSWWL